MGTRNDGEIARRLGILWHERSVRDLTDSQLLERFAAGDLVAADLAFAALVERHGPMVLRVARASLPDPADAEDAFQATFLVLVARARRLWTRDSLGPWLHQVAHRTALCMQASAARRRRLDRRAIIVRDAGKAEGSDAEQARIIHEEINRLPERYRVPVVLCDLEGQTHDEAARVLGWPIGTVKSRQARARDRLRAQLTRRGVTPGLIAILIRPPSVGSLSVNLVRTTTVAALRSLTSRAIVPGTGAALAREVMTQMNFAGLFKVGSLTLTICAASGVGFLAQSGGQHEVGTPQASPSVQPSTFEVKAGKLSFAPVERGFIEAARTRDVINEVEGSAIILKILPAGTRVAKGDLVAELESATLKDQLVNEKVTEKLSATLSKQATTMLEVAEFAVTEYVERVAPQELANLQARVAHGQVNIDRERARLERTRAARTRLDQASRRLGPEKPADILAELDVLNQIDAAEVAVQTRTLELKAAQDQQALFQDFTIRKATRELQVDVEKARVEAQTRDATWRLASNKVAKLNRQIERCKLLAPDDGTVVYASDPGRSSGPGTIEPGATVRERQILFRLVNTTDPLRINAKVHESLVGQVQPGQAVRIRVEALPDRVLTGVVQSVAPMADPLTFHGDGKKVYSTFIQIDPQVPDLRPGMTAAVEIVVFELDNVLTVPSAAVIPIDGKDRIGVARPDGVVELRAVTLGKATSEYVEVREGLQAGDHVLLPHKGIERVFLNSGGARKD